ncbi:hypothetical protein SLS57_000017 [Botryosphaeria dothidea]
MSSKDSDVRRRRKDRESDLDPPRSKDKERKKPSHKKKPRSKDHLRDSADRDRPHSSRSHSHSKKMSLVPELDRRPSTASPAATRSYPSFSKAHSRESLEPRDADAKAGKAPYTPDPTDLGGHPKDGRLSPKPTSAARAAAAPPSPPLTADEPDLRRKESGNRTRPPPVESVQHIFAPFQKLLEDYNYVMSKSGSIAVATGYRSVARRLLDRLEAVFARDISSEVCRCVMCRLKSDDVEPTDEETGVSWGEILEFVSGRRELPPWPPFSIDADAGGLGISGFNQAAPMQKLDIDVPEEYRDHYIKQSKKTKQAVQNWLATQPEVSTSPPQEVDDETLTFAMLTHLEADKRPIFTALLRGLITIPASRTPTPLNVPRPELLVKTATALQRLYRLNKPPRDPECAIFLLNHPTLHSVLATLAAVSNGEWDILISGRFDGFLWSGAEGPVPTPTYGGSSISRGPTATPLSRTTTPFSTGGGPSRGPTPFQSGTPGFGRPASTAPSSFGAPVQMDEEVEIATLAEVEREIFLGMEALEDAFEALHCKAEAVRRALRERSAGLAMAAQARRGSMDGGVEVRLGTPASGIGGWGAGGWETETDDGLDERSELAPDDSASNISFNRRRRPERRKQRNTPAPVEEEDESDLTEDAQRRR